MATQTHYSDEFKARVMASIMEGMSIREAAEEYDVPRGTIGGWSSKLNQSGVPHVSVNKKEVLGNRLVELLHQMISTQMSLLVRMQDIADSQEEIVEVATAFGISNDKLDRLIMRIDGASKD